MAMNRTGMRLIEPFRWQGEPMSDQEAAAYAEPLKDVDRLEFTLRLGANLIREACDLDDLVPIDVTTQLIYGAEDDFIDVGASDAIARRIGTKRLEVFEGCGHSPPEDEPARFVDVVTDFVDEIGCPS